MSSGFIVTPSEARKLQNMPYSNRKYKAYSVTDKHNPLKGKKLNAMSSKPTDNNNKE